MILTIRTDKPEAEIGLFDGGKQLAYHTWQGHRQLAETIHAKLQALLDEQGKTWSDIAGVVVYGGPGSFTGLRIGVSVANALAYALHVPVQAAAGEDWIKTATAQIIAGQAKGYAVPEYGSVAKTTRPKR